LPVELIAPQTTSDNFFEASRLSRTNSNTL
jgi:hypothetical protein